MLTGDLVFIGLFLAILYFLILRPQSQERSRHEALVDSLAVDMQVVTRSGMHGRIVEVGNEIVVIDVGQKTQITFEKAAVFRRFGEKVDAPANQGI